jgi:hypothetical protein
MRVSRRWLYATKSVRTGDGRHGGWAGGGLAEVLLSTTMSLTYLRPWPCPHLCCSWRHPPLHHAVASPTFRCQWAPYTPPCIRSKFHSFYHVECITSINHKWIPSSHTVLEFRFVPGVPMARRLPGFLTHQSSAGKKPPILCHFRTSQREKSCGFCVHFFVFRLLLVLQSSKWCDYVKVFWFLRLVSRFFKCVLVAHVETSLPSVAFFALLMNACVDSKEKHACKK